jgi:hypothetical protein
MVYFVGDHVQMVHFVGAVWLMLHFVGDSVADHDASICGGTVRYMLNFGGSSLPNAQL